MSDKLTIEHVRKSGHCVSGIRSTCQMHGIDLRRLIREGIPLTELEGIEDENLQQVLRIAREDE